MQIRLWETDRNRVEMIPSHLYEDFPSKVNTKSDINLLTLLLSVLLLLTDSLLNSASYAGMV
jgi:hypothetical protein